MDQERVNVISDALTRLWDGQHHCPASGDETHVTKEGWHYRADTQCFVESLSYDFSKRRGVLQMREGSCTDMMGCILLFKAIDPNVRDILTFAGDELDTSYRNDGSGEWRAIDAR